MTIATKPRETGSPSREISAVPPAAGSAAPRYYTGLDGLRALAVAAVVVYHLFPGVLPGGFVGVDIFFVISGFLITELLIRERNRDGTVNLLRFWQRRVRRLVPALVALVLGCCTIAWLIGGDVLVGIGRQVLGATTFSSNWLTIASGNSYFAQDAPALFRNLWSLAVEEQFYLLWPLALLGILLIRQARARIYLVGALALASAVAMAVLYQPATDATRVYFGSGTHSFGLTIGAVLALLLSRLRPFDPHAGENRTQVFVRRFLPASGALGLIVLGAAVCWLHDDWAATYRGGMFVASLATAVVIWAAVTPGSRLGRMLEVAPLKFVGLRSYGIYLWHWPLWVLVLAAMPDRAGLQQPWLSGLIALAITAACAWASYRYIEVPVRLHGVRGALARATAAVRASGHSRRPAVIAALVVCTIGVGGTGAAVASAPATTQAEDDAVVSRQLASAPGILHALADAGKLRPVVLLGLGTNGPFTQATMDWIQSIIGTRELVLVSVQAPRWWAKPVNTELRKVAEEDPRQVVLADWQHAIAHHIDLLADDDIHPGPAGGRIYVSALRDALQRHADLPPIQTTRGLKPY